MHRTPTGGIQITHAGRERVKAVQWLTKRIQAQRLHVVLQIGMRLTGVGLHKRPQLARCHAHGPGTLQCVLESDHGLTPPTVGHRVECLHALNREDGTNL